jgi:KipI family sensor histidine kinase inhibitor
MGPAPRLLPAGECALVVEYGDTIDADINARVRALAAVLDREAPAGMVETVPTYRSLMIHYDPAVLPADAVERLVRDADARVPTCALPAPRVIEVPTVYGGEDGPDLDEVAARAGLRADEVVALHAGTDYLVYMMGFMPGFPYLGGMSPRIAVPRLGTPRTVVPAGSVGIAGGQTGIYPTESPGGWRLIGRTHVTLFDVARTPPALIAAGDLVRFVPVERHDAVAAGPRAVAETPGASGAAAVPGFTVVDGGLLTTVQDLGRTGSQRYGVPVAGAMDRWALCAANRLTGNADTMAGLEITLAGPAIRFDVDAVVAVTGADLRPEVDGRPIAMWQSHRVRAGCLLRFAAASSGLRAYLAVAGGVDVPVVLGSRSTFTRSGIGGHLGRALQAGDRVPIGRPAPVAADVVRRFRPNVRPAGDRARELRVVLGPQDDAFTPDGIATFLSASYTVTPQSDRVGCRLAGPRVTHRSGADIVSDGTVFGAVQVTGDGVPIILMADCGTTGGYTKIATVISADLGLVAQAAPGDTVRFLSVDLAQACATSRSRETALDLVEASSPPDGAELVYEEDSGADLAADGYAEFAAALGTALGPHAVHRDLVRAAMPGLIVEVLVAKGERVEARRVLASIEAMKMQNAVRAPRAGRVARVLVAPGTSVETGAPIIEFEPE